jgi:hypothetical protein
MPKRALVFAAITTLVACGSSTETTTGSGGSTTGSATGGSSTGTGTYTTETFSVTYDPLTVMPGEEHTRCVVKRLNNPNPIHVGTIHNQLNDGSHHLIVYKVGDTMEQTTPFDCQPFTDLLDPSKGTPLMISQKKDDTLTLPKGVAFNIDANQMVRLEMHYINTTPNPLQVSATSTFVSMDDKDFENEAGFLFVGDPDINIAPQSSFTLGPIYTPEPAMLAGSKYFGVTGHEHHFGTSVTVATTTGKTGTDTPIYDVPGWSWSEPKTVYLDPPATIPTGGGFRFTCSWNNTSANNVKFGESANDEMCFFWTYYYPSKGAFVCAHSEKVPGGIDLCCPGSPLCSYVF